MSLNGGFARGERVRDFPIAQPRSQGDHSKSRRVSGPGNSVAGKFDFISNKRCCATLVMAGRKMRSPFSAESMAAVRSSSDFPSAKTQRRPRAWIAERTALRRMW